MLPHNLCVQGVELGATFLHQLPSSALREEISEHEIHYDSV